MKSPDGRMLAITTANDTPVIGADASFSNLCEHAGSFVNPLFLDLGAR